MFACYSNALSSFSEYHWNIIFINVQLPFKSLQIFENLYFRNNVLEDVINIEMIVYIKPSYSWRISFNQYIFQELI